MHTEAVDDLPRDDLLAATPEIAARLAGVTVRQVNYWREIGLIEPAVARRISARNEVRLYDFTGLVELRIVAALRSKLTLQHIRQVINRLRASYYRPLTELRFAVQGTISTSSTPTALGKAAGVPVRSSWPKSSCWRRSGPISGGRQPSATGSRAGW